MRSSKLTSLILAGALSLGLAAGDLPVLAAGAPANRLADANGPVSVAASSVTVSPASLPADNTSLATVTVTLRDAAGIPVIGKSVSITSNRGAMDTIAPGTVTTNISGVALFTVKSPTAGQSVITATDLTSNLTLPQTAFITFLSGATSSTQSSIVVSPGTVAVGSLATVTVSLRDANSNPLAAKEVRLSSNRSGNDTITPPVAGTNTAGIASFNIASTLAGTSLLTATVTTDNVVLSQSPSITFVTDTPSPSVSTLFVSPTTVLLGSPATATVTLKDGNGNLVSGKSVSLASNRGGIDTITPGVVVTNGSGVATFSVSSLAAGSAVLTATDTSDGFPLLQTAAVTFSATAPAGSTVSPALSTLTASASSVGVGGSTSVVLTLRDTSAQPVAGHTVLLTSNRSSNDTIVPTPTITNGAGQATFTVTSAVGGTATFTALDLTAGIVISQTAVVSFSSSTVSASTSTVTASPATLGLGSASTITVTLRDASAIAVPNKTVVLTSNRGGSDTIAPATAITTGAGTATFTVTSSVPGTASFTASDITDSITVTQTATVTFTAGSSGGSTVGFSTFTASPASVGAGAGSSTLTLVLRDSSGLALPGKTVIVSSSRPTIDTIQPAAAVTDAAGLATFTVRSTTAGVSVYTVFDTTDAQTVAQTAAVTYVVAADGGLSTLNATPTTVTSNAASTASVVVILRDANSNPVPGKVIILTSNRGGADIIQPGSVTTGSDGSATFTVASTTSGQSVLTATNTTDGMTLGQTATITFVSGFADPSASAISAGSTTLPTGVAGAVTVNVRDSARNPVPNRNVILTSNRGASIDTISPAVAASNNQGQATFNVTSTTPGAAVFTATIDGSMIPQPLTLTFASNPADPAASVANVAPPSVAADGRSPVTLTVILQDAQGGLIPGKTVSVTSSRGAVDTITPPTAITSTGGQAVFTVTSTSSGTATFTINNITDGGKLTATPTVTFTQAFGVPTSAAPTPLQPEAGVQLSTPAPLLAWSNPPGTTWFQVQVIPTNNDGPGIDLMIGDAGQVATAQYQVQGPAFGAIAPNYVMLPGMTYSWRVRTSTIGITPSELDWTPWSTMRTFRTPVASSTGITLVNPAAGGAVSTLTPTLLWANSDTSVFYYEVQVSRDQSFSTAPGSPTLYWELRHGGATTPQNSYTIPSSQPLQARTTYYWRVRPRVQGDGAPVAWSTTGSFTTP